MRNEVEMLKGLVFRAKSLNEIRKENFVYEKAVSLKDYYTKEEIDRLLKGYVHSQTSASDTWEIAHNLNKKPLITVVDENDEIVFGDVNYVNDNIVVIRFTSAFSGKAYLL